VPAASAAIFRADGKVLLAKRAKPPFQWSFPGGKLEPGESAEEAAVREAREEVAVEIKIIGKAGERAVTLPERRFLISVFAARIVSGEAQPGPEASEIGWFAVGDIETLDATPGLFDSARLAEHIYLAAKA
jgi:8-oxo-dGTP diphosphatase